MISLAHLLRHICAAAVLACLFAGCGTLSDLHDMVPRLSQKLPKVPERYLELTRPNVDRHMKEIATSIDYSNVNEPGHESAAFSGPPRRITEPQEGEIRDVSLAEVIQIALSNSEIIRSSGSFKSPANSLMVNPMAISSVFNPALQESGVLFGNRGVEAALADFDPRFLMSTNWGRNEQIQNNRFISGGLNPGDTLSEDTGQVLARIEKTMATGGTFFVSHQVDYSLNNVPSRLFGSVFTGFLRTGFTQPLLQGAGTEFTRIAGPISSNLQGVSGVGQGVVLARINTDISIADFEAAVRNLLKDVEDLYWNLALAYRAWDAEVENRNSAFLTWREVKAKLVAGTGSAADEAQGQDNYFSARARAENALADLYDAELRLRRLIGMMVNDGQILRPLDEPTVAKFQPEWEMALAEALTNRVELRRLKWQIKSFELQMRAARNLKKPRLDLSGDYAFNMFGDHLLRFNGEDGITDEGLNSAYTTLARGNQSTWGVGLNLFIPIGFRREHAQIKNIEIQLAKARAALAAMELEISHELGSAFQSTDRFYQTAQTNFNRLRAAKRRVDAFKAEYVAGRTSLDLLLRAQVSRSQAEIAYYRSLVEYNKAIADVHYRKGTLLSHDNISLAEGGWDPKAYTLALRRAWARAHAISGDHLRRTKPEEFATGKPEWGVQFIGGELPAEVSLPGGTPTTSNEKLETAPQLVPVPAPSVEESTISNGTE